MRTEWLACPPEGWRDPARIRAIFARIVRRYDRINRVLSLGLDRGWREVAAEAVAQAPPGPVLDVGVGTGELARAVTCHGRPVVLGVDFCRPMLQAAQSKIASQHLPIALVEGDALALPFADGAFAVGAAGFSLRNVADLDRVLREAYRVTMPGGRLVSLEMCAPQRWRRTHQLYQTLAMPILGALFGGAVAAYLYLPVSIRTFPTAEGLRQRMESAGWQRVRYLSLAWGAVAIHIGERPSS